jgi:hypothetical protein
VIRITDQEQKVRAVIVNYACHPVVLGPQNSKLSADYPGVMREIVESEFGSECMCIFIQGAAGDINPLILARGDNRENDFTYVKRQGELLAIEVKRALSFIKDTQGISDSVSIASKESQFHNRWKPAEQFTMGATTLLINDNIGILTMPGEPFHHFQIDFRNRAGLKHAYLFGYCCDGPYAWPSYLPDVESAARGGYGASDKTEAEVGAGERLLIDGLIQLYTLQGRLKKTPRLHTYEKNPE